MLWGYLIRGVHLEIDEYEKVLRWTQVVHCDGMLHKWLGVVRGYDTTW